MVAAVTFSDVMLTVHVLAVVVAFGGALTYPVWFRLIRDGTPEQRAFFHDAQAKLGKFVITPSIVVLFATGAYLAFDDDLWGVAWVLIPTGITILILILGAGLLGPSEERLSEYAARGEEREYGAVLRRVKAATWLCAVLVIAATFSMVARQPGSSDDGDATEGSASRGAELFVSTGCASCHTLEAAGGTGTDGPNLDEAAADLTAAEVRDAVASHPDEFDERLSDEDFEALTGFVAASAGSGD